RRRGGGAVGSVDLRRGAAGRGRRDLADGGPGLRGAGGHHRGLRAERERPRRAGDGVRDKRHKRRLLQPAGGRRLRRGRAGAVSGPVRRHPVRHRGPLRVRGGAQPKHHEPVRPRGLPRLGAPLPARRRGREIQPGAHRRARRARSPAPAPRHRGAPGLEAPGLVRRPLLRRPRSSLRLRCRLRCRPPRGFPGRGLGRHQGSQRGRAGRGGDGRRPGSRQDPQQLDALRQRRRGRGVCAGGAAERGRGHRPDQDPRAVERGGRGGSGARAPDRRRVLWCGVAGPLLPDDGGGEAAERARGRGRARGDAGAAAAGSGHHEPAATPQLLPVPGRVPEPPGPHHGVLLPALRGRAPGRGRGRSARGPHAVVAAPAEHGAGRGAGHALPPLPLSPHRAPRPQVGQLAGGRPVARQSGRLQPQPSAGAGQHAQHALRDKPPLARPRAPGRRVRLLGLGRLGLWHRAVGAHDLEPALSHLQSLPDHLRRAARR
ncbi:hypothetical protein H632_c3042p0, partial [Helicosporidium sp. ATCC 50920]